MESAIIPQESLQFIRLPDEECYVLLNCSVPQACLRNVPWHSQSSANADALVRCNIHIGCGTIQKITQVSNTGQAACLDLEDACVFPTFVDIHTHIGMCLSAFAHMRSILMSDRQRDKHLTQVFCAFEIMHGSEAFIC
jgi:hypothetical protein